MAADESEAGRLDDDVAAEIGDIGPIVSVTGMVANCWTVGQDSRAVDLGDDEFLSLGAIVLSDAECLAALVLPDGGGEYRRIEMVPPAAESKPVSPPDLRDQKWQVARVSIDAV